MFTRTCCFIHLCYDGQQGSLENIKSEYVRKEGKGWYCLVNEIQVGFYILYSITGPQKMVFCMPLAKQAGH